LSESRKGREINEETRKKISDANKGENNGMAIPIEVDGEEIYLNSAKQIAMPFLFDKPASFRMKLFNKLTGTDLLDKLFGKFIFCNESCIHCKRSYFKET
jgi:hypothetical protein